MAPEALVGFGGSSPPSGSGSFLSADNKKEKGERKGGREEGGGGGTTRKEAGKDRQAGGKATPNGGEGAETVEGLSLDLLLPQKASRKQPPLGGRTPRFSLKPAGEEGREERGRVTAKRQLPPPYPLPPPRLTCPLLAQRRKESDSLAALRNPGCPHPRNQWERRKDTLTGKDFILKYGSFFPTPLPFTCLSPASSSSPPIAQGRSPLFCHIMRPGCGKRHFRAQAIPPSPGSPSLNHMREEDWGGGGKKRKKSRP